MRLPPEDAPEQAGTARFRWPPAWPTSPGSLPDDELAEAAESGALMSLEVAAAAERMLDDPKAQALFDNPLTSGSSPEGRRSNRTSWSMTTSMTTSGSPWPRYGLPPFLRRFRATPSTSSPPRPLHQRHAGEHYDMAPVGPDFVRVEEHGAPRGGILRQAGVLSATLPPIVPRRRGADGGSWRSSSARTSNRRRTDPLLRSDTPRRGLHRDPDSCSTSPTRPAPGVT